MATVDLDEREKIKTINRFSDAIRPNMPMTAKDVKSMNKTLQSIDERLEENNLLSKQAVDVKSKENEYYRKQIEKEVMQVVRGSNTPRNIVQAKKNSFSDGTQGEQAYQNKQDIERKDEKLQKRFDKIAKEEHIGNKEMVKILHSIYDELKKETKESQHTASGISGLIKGLTGFLLPGFGRKERFLGHHNPNANGRGLHIGRGYGGKGLLAAGAGVGGLGLYNNITKAWGQDGKVSGIQAGKNIFEGALQGAMTGGSIGMIFGPEGAAVGAGIGALIGEVSVAVAEYHTKIANFFTSIENGIENGIKFFDGKVKSIGSDIGHTFSNIFLAVTNGFNSMGTFLYDQTIGRLPKWAQDKLGGFSKIVGNEISTIGGKIEAGANAIQSKFVGSAQKAESAASSAVKTAVEVVKGGAQQFVSDTKTTVAPVTGEVSKVAGNVSNVVAPAITSIGSQLSTGYKQGMTSDGQTAKKNFTSQEQQQNVATALAFFQKAGWTKEQAAGIVGNAMVESSMNPNAVNSIGMRGLFQWDHSRWAQLVSKGWGTDLNAQLAFANWELNNSPNGMQAGKALRNAKTAADAAAVFDEYFERPGAADNSLGNRIAWANKSIGTNTTIGPIGQSAISNGSGGGLSVATATPNLSGTTDSGMSSGLSSGTPPVTTGNMTNDQLLKELTDLAHKQWEALGTIVNQNKQKIRDNKAAALQAKKIATNSHNFSWDDIGMDLTGNGINKILKGS